MHQTLETRGSAVLIVDDDNAAQISLQAVLEDEFEVFTVSNLLEAKEALKTRSFDVVVTDYAMPGGSGLDLIQTLSKEFPTVVGILLTGYADAPEVKSAKEDKNVFLVLRKSYQPGFIVEWVKNAVRFSRTQKRIRGITTKSS